MSKKQQEPLYVGRIVGIGQTPDGNNFAAYRVSSRSYPNRSAVIDGDTISIESKKGAEKENEASPYVAYMCVIALEKYVIVSNGEQTQPIADKISAGQEPQDALARTLTDMGYEHDDYSTPRIAGVIPASGDVGWLGIVRNDGIVVQRVDLQAGKISYIATYEHSTVYPDNVIETSSTTANQLASDAVDGVDGWANLQNPVTSAVAVWSGSNEGVDLAVKDVE